MTALFTALFLTWTVESAVLLVCSRAHALRCLVASALINGFTNPLANWAFAELGWSFVVVETLVWGTEAVLISALLELDARRALLYALAMNVPTAALSSAG